MCSSGCRRPSWRTMRYRSCFTKEKCTNCKWPYLENRKIKDFVSEIRRPKADSGGLGDQAPSKSKTIGMKKDSFSAVFFRASGGTRTRTAVSGQGILSPSCLPFHHQGMGCKGSVFLIQLQSSLCSLPAVDCRAHRRPDLCPAASSQGQRHLILPLVTRFSRRQGQNPSFSPLTE